MGGAGEQGRRGAGEQGKQIKTQILRDGKPLLDIAYEGCFFFQLLPNSSAEGKSTQRPWDTRRLNLHLS